MACDGHVWPEFFTGRLIQRFGVATVTVTGLLLLAAAGAARRGLELRLYWRYHHGHGVPSS